MIATIRRLTSFVAAFALVYAMAAPALGVCERSHPTGGVNTSVSEHGDGGHSECAESMAPERDDGNTESATSCVSMVGCSATGFMVESVLSSAATESSPPLTLATQPHPSRFLGPELPPPKA